MDTEQIVQAEQWLENTANNIYDGRYIGKDCAKTALEIVRAFGVLVELADQGEHMEVSKLHEHTLYPDHYCFKIWQAKSPDRRIWARTLVAAIQSAKREDNRGSQSHAD